MADWTIILTTLGASGISATVAYAAARRASSVELARLAVERDRFRETVNEGRRNERVTNYLALLTQSLAFGDVFDTTVRFARTAQDAWQTTDHWNEKRAEWANDMRRAVSGVQIFAPRGVSDAAVALMQIAESVQEAFVDAWFEREDVTSSGPDFRHILEARNQMGWI